MPALPEPIDHEEWQPATSLPGELYTPEGQSRARWSALKGATTDDPRRVAYRRSMVRTGLVFVAITLGAGALVAVVVSLL